VVIRGRCLKEGGVYFETPNFGAVLNSETPKRNQKRNQKRITEAKQGSISDIPNIEQRKEYNHSTIHSKNSFILKLKRLDRTF